MRKKSSLPAHLSRLLRAADLVVSYSPMRDEPDPRSIVELAGPKSRVVTLGQNPAIGPVETARELHESHSDVERAILLVPGRAFDLTGTRHGRGRGWYDRFLHEIPRHWLRVGIATSDRIHEKKLLRQPWDEPMDWLLVSDADGWHTRRCTDRHAGQS